MNIRARQAIYASLAALLGIYAVGHLTGSQGISALMEKRSQIQQLETETQLLGQENKELGTYLSDLKSDPDLQRRLVRERLHYVDENTVDFKTQDETKPEAKPTAAKSKKAR